MAKLVTLSGSDSGELEKLFDANDVLGVMIYGAPNWNKLKSYVANECLSELYKARHGGRKSTYYKPTNDVVETALGFNHQRGAALMGGDAWGHFVNRCKTAVPVLGYDWFGNLFARPTQRVVRSLTPSNFSAKELATFALGLKPMVATYDIINDVSGRTEKTENQAYAERQAEKQRQADLEYYNAAMQKYLQEEQIKSDEAVRIAAAQAEAEASQKVGEANAAAALKSSPEYQAAQVKKVALISLAVVAGVAIYKNVK